jgi:hypothetical protein
MQEKSTMECTIQWIRKTYSTLRSASTKHASRADARVSVFVHAPCTYPLMLVAVDMAQKNSVIADYRKQTCTKGKLQDAADNMIT